QPAMRRRDALPMHRERALEIAAAVADRAVEILAQHGEVGGAARHDAVLALEAERDAEVKQLEHVEIDRRVSLQLLEQVEEAVAAPGLAVEGADHALLRPDAAA